jgi:hypothetical protein
MSEYPLSDHEYVAASGQKCPACGSQEIEAERLDSDTLNPTATVIVIVVNCNACGAGWDDVYRIEGYQGLNDEDGDDITRADTPAGKHAEEFHEYLLDVLVYDVKSEEATSINNRGVEAQLEYLLGSGFTVAQLHERTKYHRLTPASVERMKEERSKDS